MQIQFWGAAGTVTGSMHLLEIAGRKLLLDCGLYQGRRRQAYEINRNLPFPAGQIDAVVLSHAHIDHSGNLPTLVRNGFTGRIHCTPATGDLAEIMLLDSAHIQESDVGYVNRQRLREGQRPFEPLYTTADARRTLQQLTGHGYDEPFAPIPGVQVRLLDAGHMLGSAIVVLDITGMNGHRTRLVFSGDLGRQDQPILRDPRSVAGVDWLIMESTYGDRLHEDADLAKHELLDFARQAFETGGKILIPAFAVGRTQEVIYRLNQLWEAGALPPLRVFVDSPLAINATTIFRRHPECFDAEMLSALQREADGNPLAFPRLEFCRTPEESKRLNELPEPAIIISASGMCESGRILHHLKNHIGDPRTVLLFVGYQAENTLGRKLLDGHNSVSILGMDYKVRAKVRHIEGYSAHADRGGLLGWAEQLRQQGRVRQVFLVHGEDHGPKALRAGLLAAGFPEVIIPQRGQRYNL